MHSIDFKQYHYFNNINSVFYNLLCVEEEVPNINDIKDIESFKKKERQDVQLAIIDVENILPHAEGHLTQFYRLKPNLRQEGYEYLIGRIKETMHLLNDSKVSLLNERINWLNIVGDIVNHIFVTERLNLEPTEKLKINAPTNVIYDLFRQLKNTYLEDKNPVFSQSYKQLARFLKSNVHGFEDISIDTIENQLTRQQTISKTRLKVSTF